MRRVFLRLIQWKRTLKKIKQVWKELLLNYYTWKVDSITDKLYKEINRKNKHSRKTLYKLSIFGYKRDILRKELGCRENPITKEKQNN